MEHRRIKHIFMFLAVALSYTMVISCGKKKDPEQVSEQPNQTEESQAKDSGDTPEYYKCHQYEMDVCQSKII